MNRRTLLGVVGSLAVGGCLSDLAATGPPIDVTCPDFADYAESRCVHTGDPELTLRPSAWQLDDGAGVSLEFTLSNDTDRSARVADFPSLKRRVDDEWEHVWPIPVAPFEKTVGPGASYSWELLFGEDESAHDADETVDLFELDRGTYAAVVDAEFEDDDIVQCVAPFEVEGGDGE